MFSTATGDSFVRFGEAAWLELLLSTCNSIAETVEFSV